MTEGWIKHMKIQYFILMVVWFSSLLSSRAFAQCSDAGVCTIGYSPLAEEKKHSFELLYRYGNSGKEDKIGYNSIELKASFKILSHTSFNISVPLYRLNTGPDGEVSGIGDLMAFIGQEFNDAFGHDISALLGMRLATGNDNADPALPQAYQPGLGTNDLIFGLKFAGKNYYLSAGYQRVEDTFTENTLTPIRRGDDAYLQFAYLFHTGEFNIRADAQLIQRLSKTELKNPDGSISQLNKTDQMQLNLGTEFEYVFSATHNLIGGFAFPILKRETNIDGLTRVFTLFAGWRIYL
jgi:hypothetical protein